MAQFVHRDDCIHVTMVTCRWCETAALAENGRGERIIAAMQTAHDEAVAAGQTAKANAIQLMIDKVSTVQ
jgi:hypothetical protein